jgi:hypothetical protein
MKFSSKEQAASQMKLMGYSDEDTEWIVKRL